jgi:hypothetical protein
MGDVQAFYERYPYPGPVDSLDDYRQLWADPQRRQGWLRCCCRRHHPSQC